MSPKEVRIEVISRVTIWLIYNAAFGLLPVFLIFSSSIFTHTEIAEASKQIASHGVLPEILKGILSKVVVADASKEIISHGVITFFCLAIMGSVSIDFVFSELTYGRFVTYLINTLPYVVIVIMLPLFYETTLKDPTQKLLDLLYLYQIISIIGSVVYCSLIKGLIFAEEATKKPAKKKTTK